MGTAGCCDFQGELWDIIMANCAARCLFLAVLSNIRTLTGERDRRTKGDFTDTPILGDK